MTHNDLQHLTLAISLYQKARKTVHHQMIKRKFTATRSNKKPQKIYSHPSMVTSCSCDGLALQRKENINYNVKQYGANRRCKEKFPLIKWIKRTEKFQSIS